jgi:hypothetical protein
MWRQLHVDEPFDDLTRTFTQDHPLTPDPILGRAHLGHRPSGIDDAEAESKPENLCRRDGA